MSPFHLVLFDDDYREQFLPLAWTRPLADFRIGIFTIREKWEARLKSASTTSTAAYLAAFAWPFEPDTTKHQLWINSRVLPSGALAFEVMSLQPGEALMKGELLVACNAGKSAGPLNAYTKDHLTGDFSLKQSNAPAIILHRINDLFLHNGKAIEEDFELLKGRTSETLSATNTVFGTHPVFVGKNVKAEACTINTTKGPVYIGEGAELMEGCNLRGPLAIGAGAVIKMGAKIYGDTTIGNGCKVGGEVTNSIFFANSNKSHDGYIGNSVIGEWCNLGADTNCSNLKNNYGNVSVWNYAIGGEEDTGLQFHGLIMGDHAKSGINTMFNTGTVVGVSANVFGTGFPPKFLPDFSWGQPIANQFAEYRLDEALQTIARVYERRDKKLSEAEIKMLSEVFAQTKKYRK